MKKDMIVLFLLLLVLFSGIAGATFFGVLLIDNAFGLNQSIKVCSPAYEVMKQWLPSNEYECYKF